MRELQPKASSRMERALRMLRNKDLKRRLLLWAQQKGRAAQAVLIFLCRQVTPCSQFFPSSTSIPPAPQELPVPVQPPPQCPGSGFNGCYTQFRRTCPFSFSLGYVWGLANPSRGCSPLCTVVASCSVLLFLSMTVELLLAQGSQPAVCGSVLMSP